ncbi:MAG: hypothetical protein WC284_08840 [Candidimonas sp.]|jgi:hypothetical protein
MKRIKSLSSLENSGFQRKRRWQFIAFSISLAILAMAAFWFTQARYTLADAYSKLSISQRDHARALQAEAIVRKEVELANLIDKTLQVGTAQSMNSRDWGERRVQVRNTSMSRQAVNDLLTGVARQPGRLFGAEHFDVSVSRAEDGLFSSFDESFQQPDLVVSLEGTLLFQVDQP